MSSNFGLLSYLPADGLPAALLSDLQPKGTRDQRPEEKDDRFNSSPGCFQQPLMHPSAFLRYGCQSHWERRFDRDSVWTFPAWIEAR